jgi:hypothetical protein
MDKITEDTNITDSQNDDCGHLPSDSLTERRQNLRYLQSSGSRPGSFHQGHFSLDGTIKSCRFELRRWLGMERDSQRGREERKQELVTLVFAIATVCIIVLAAGNTTSARHADEISSTGTSHSID